MSLRVARIPYLNSLPFYTCLPAGTEVLDLPPRQLGEAAAAGAVDAGILSLCDILQNPDLVALGSMGVAARGPVHSVLLFSRQHPERLDGARVAVTSETSTSFPLLRLLLAQRFGVGQTTFERRAPASDSGADVDAHLLIGDAALVAAAAAGLVPGRSQYRGEPMPVDAAGASSWQWVLDLAGCWVDWQQLPFVFAEWVVRRQAPAGACDELSAALQESLRRFEEDPAALAQAAAASGPLDAAAVRAYLDGFTYRLGEDERAGVARFRALLENEPWWQPDTAAASLSP